MNYTVVYKDGMKTRFGTIEVNPILILMNANHFHQVVRNHAVQLAIIRTILETQNKEPEAIELIAFSETAKILPLG